MDAVNKIPYEGRGTKTNAALGTLIINLKNTFFNILIWLYLFIILFIEYAVNEALTLENGDRPDVPNFVLVLTDGAFHII